MEIRDQLHAPATLLVESEPTTRSVGGCVTRRAGMDVLEREEFLDPKICYAVLQLLGSFSGES
jgi:hypothetical protein